MNKDYTLLRPFELEKAKAGEALYFNDGTAVRFIGFDSRSRIVIESVVNGCLFQYEPKHLRMAPLAWVEGKPVYRGDVLYSNIGPRIIVGADTTRLRGVVEENTPWGLFDPQYLTWTPPKKTREVKLLGWLDSNNRVAFGTFDCVQGMNWKRIPELDRTVTVEE